MARTKAEHIGGLAVTLPLPKDIPRVWKGARYRHHWTYINPVSPYNHTFDVRYEHPDGRKEIIPFTELKSGWKSTAMSAPRMIFGLNTIGSGLHGHDIFVVEGCKCATAMHLLGLPCVASQGGARAAGKSDWTPLSGLGEYIAQGLSGDDEGRVIIVPDNDGDGLDYAHEVAACLVALKYPPRNVFIAQLPDVPEKGDVCEWIKARVPAWDEYGPIPTEPGQDLVEDFLETIEAAIQPIRGPEKPEPVPLRREIGKAYPFPLDALGPHLAPVAQLLQEADQVPAALVGQSLLAGAALAVQGHADIVVDGRVYPLSLFAVSAGESGDRKSATDRRVLEPHRQFQKAKIAQYEADRVIYDHAVAAYEAAKKKILGTKKSQHEMEHELAGLDVPIRPLFPVLLVADLTVEGLDRQLQHGTPSIGIFADEGGRVVGGHAMSKDNLLKTLSALSKLWDGDGGVKVRAGEGTVVAYGRRVSAHLMMQPDVARVLFGQTIAHTQGFLPRCLIAWPESLRGTRLYRHVDVSTTREYREYLARMEAILYHEPPQHENPIYGLKPRHLFLSDEAKRLYTSFHDDVERRNGPNGALAAIYGWASKAAEHALRIAGVLALIEDININQLAISHMQAGVVLAEFYMAEYLRIVGESTTDPVVDEAEKVLEFIRAEGGEVNATALLQRGPRCIRTADRMKEVMGVLERYNHVVSTSRDRRRFSWKLAG